MRINPPDKKHLFAVSYLALLALGLFSTALDGALLLTERDLSVFFIPPRIFWAEAVRNWELPLWNPYSYSGHPFLATLQPGIFYPLNLLLVILPFDLAFNWEIVIHFMLAGAFTFLFIRGLKGSFTASLTGALIFMLSGYLFSVHNVISTLFTVTWVPLALYLFQRALKKGSLGCSLASGVVLAVMFTGGGVEALFGTILLLLVLAVFPSALDMGGDEHDAQAPLWSDHPAILRRLLLLFASASAFVLLSAVQLLPFLELASHSTRAGGLSYFEATTWSFDAKDFIQFFIPDLYGYGVSNEKYWSNQSWLKTVYTGVIPFILSVFFIMERRRKALPLFLIALIYLMLAMGKNTLVYPYLYSYFPFINKIRYPVKFLFMTFFLLSVAAGFGFTALERGMDEGRAGVKRALIALLFISTLAAIAFGALNFFAPAIRDFLINKGIDYPEYNYVKINLFNTKRVLFFLIVYSITIYGCMRSALLRRYLPHASVIILSIDLFFAHAGYYASTPSAEYHKKGHVMSLISQNEGDRGQGNGLYRVFVTPRTMREDMSLPEDGAFGRIAMTGMDMDKERVTGYNVEHRVFDINGIEVMRRGDYTEIADLIGSQRSADSTNILSMLNVKYVVSLPPIDSKEFRLVKVIGASDAGQRPKDIKKNADARRLEKHKALKVYENLNCLPRFFMAGRFRVVKRRDEYLKALADKAFNPGREVLLDASPWRSPPEGYRDGAIESEIDVIRYENNRVELKVNNSSPGILVASESYYPGWKAYVDGHEREILKADYILRGLPLEAGEHTVRFEYRPLSFRAGAYISAAALSALALFCFLGMIRSGKNG